MKTISRLALILCAAIFLFSTCKKEKEDKKCENPEQKDMPVKKEWMRWFDSLPPNVKQLTCFSDGGKSEIYYTSNLIYRQLAKHIPDSCLDYISEESYLEYTSLSNTFNFEFDFTYNGKSYPVIKGEFYQKVIQPYANRDMVYYSIDTPINSYIKALNPNPPGNDSICGCCSFIQQFTTKKGEIFEDVMVVESTSTHFYTDNTIKRVYISKHYGLVEFVTSKGVTWTFELL